jgi:hypothetical protein
MLSQARQNPLVEYADSLYYFLVGEWLCFSQGVSEAWAIEKKKLRKPNVLYFARIVAIVILKVRFIDLLES